MEEALTDVRLQLLSAQSEIEKLQENNYNLKQVLSDKENKLKKLEEEKAKLSKILQDKEKEYKELSDNDIKANNVYLSQKELEIDKLENLVSEYKNKIENLSFNLINVKNELSKVQKNI
ncbi:MAG: hypothetical protein M0C28_31420 [Candidatus Moduliflexus flocculans]|nr:hypothetical protein [Candidatus Moduliflexus flocculans]